MGALPSFGVSTKAPDFSELLYRPKQVWLQAHIGPQVCFDLQLDRVLRLLDESVPKNEPKKSGIYSHPGVDGI